MGEFRMPSLGADMEAGTLVEWMVKPGDQVHRGDVVAVVNTEKAAIEVEVFESGVVEDLCVAEGERVPVGTVLATLRSSGEPLAAVPPPTAAAVNQRAAEAQTPAAIAATGAAATQAPTSGRVLSPLIRHAAEQRGVDIARLHGTGRGGVVTRDDVESAAAAALGVPELPRASPRARRAAERLGVDIAAVTGTGPGGSVTGGDVERHAASRVTPRESQTVTEPVGPVDALKAVAPAERQAAMRRAIGRLMARSSREIPHYYLAHHIDLAAARGWLESENARRPVTHRLLMPALLLKAAARAAREVPDMNGFWIDDAFKPAEHVHVGLVISLRQGGLVAPAIHDTDRLSLDELMAQLRDLVTRARAGTLRSSEMADPTLTVTNLGDQGVEAVYGVIFPPQVALVGFGKVAQRPWAVDGLLGVRPVISATLAGDHRASDGLRGALFLAAVDRRLQRPEDL